MNVLEWCITDQLIPYPQALTLMEKRVDALYKGNASEMIWLLQHPPIYTAGTSARDHDLLEDSLPIYRSGRGGQYTYHGPGQRVGYVILDLRARGRDLGKFIRNLEEWLIQTLAWFNILGQRRAQRVGIWIDMHPYHPVPGFEAKIAAIGIRVRHWISFHGFSLNVNPDLSHFRNIIPCGLKGYGVTSFQDLGYTVTLSEIDQVLQTTWSEVFENNNA